MSTGHLDLVHDRHRLVGMERELQVVFQADQKGTLSGCSGVAFLRAVDRVVVAFLVVIRGVVGVDKTRRRLV